MIIESHIHAHLNLHPLLKSGYNTGWSDLMTSCMLQDAFGGMMFNVDMLTDNSMELTNPASNTEPSYYIYRITMIVLSLLKAFFIVAEFMHMWYEVRRFVFYTLITTTLLFWFILSLLWEGSFFLDNRNDKNQFTTEIKV
jgi:hypothetical protein